MDDALIRRAALVVEANLALGNEVFEAHGGTFIRNGAFASFDAANRVAVTDALSQDDVDRIRDRVDKEYAHSQ